MNPNHTSEMPPPPKTWDDVDLVLLSTIDLIVKKTLPRYPDSKPLRDMAYLLQCFTVAVAEIDRLTKLCHAQGLVTAKPTFS